MIFKYKLYKTCDDINVVRFQQHKKVIWYSNKHKFCNEKYQCRAQSFPSFDTNWARISTLSLDLYSKKKLMPNGI